MDTTFAYECLQAHPNLRLSTMKSIEKLRAAKDLADVANLLGFKTKTLAYLLYRVPPNRRYSAFQINKTSGGSRNILAPIAPLKLVQKRLSDHLQSCLTGIEKSQIARPNCVISHGFKPGFSIATNAANHIGRQWVFNLDLEDFFPSINFGRVRGYFIKNKHFQLNEKVATILAQIICHDNQLPQGAPTSPIISNLIANLLDIRINRLAAKNRCSFTRYADDITLSTNLKEFPASIARKSFDGKWEVSTRLSKQINRCGFQINSAKTRMQFRRSRQDVTGLTVNTRVGVKREKVKLLRTQVESLLRIGSCHKNKMVNGVNVSELVSPATIQGQLSHLHWVKLQTDGSERVPADWKEEHGYVRLYRRFLDHQLLVTGARPTIICEGKTDNIYIKCAISILKNAPTNLKDTNQPDGLSVRLFRYTRTTSAIQRLGGGTGDLKNFIASYSERLKSIRANFFSSPVILVVDNDSGATKGKLNSVVKSASQSAIRVDGSKDFYKIGRNLYIVYTPKSASGGDTMIEDFLPSAAKSHKLGTKTLELDSNKFDETKNYGKVLLAEQIISRQKTQIDFSGFLPLLDRISKAIEDFSSTQKNSPSLSV